MESPPIDWPLSIKDSTNEGTFQGKRFFSILVALFNTQIIET
jgi:hypothetical protein